MSIQSLFSLTFSHRNSGSELAELINTYIKDGKIVPVKITCGLIEKVSSSSLLFASTAIPFLFLFFCVVLVAAKFGFTET